VDLDPAAVRRIVAVALDEDLGERGDVTTDALLQSGARCRARILARDDLVLAGGPVAVEVFRALDDSLELRLLHPDGARLTAGELVATLCGDPRPILRGERTALNFLMRMSGIASAAAAAVAEVRGSGCRILDTRKTAPGLRHLDKYAVACGGATNHRMGLHDAVMIKDTHLGTGCGVLQAVALARERGQPRESITVEVRSLAMLEQAIEAGAGRALLDNMELDAMRQAVDLGRGRIVLEASGGLRPGALREVAATGVDCISLGWLTHSAPAANLAMELELDG
jgi:nicotinate-nucleotide pyrophosphorylase (carboxylating)